MKNDRLVHHNERIAKSCVCCGSRTLKKSPAVLMPFVAYRVFGWEPVEITDAWGLKTIRNGMAYSVCNSVLCTNCGLIFLDIRFTEEEMHNLYSGYRDATYIKLREKYEPRYSVRNTELEAGIDYLSDIEQFLAPHLKFPVRILDWGGDSGSNTPFRSNNRLFHIYDISDNPVIEGAKKISKHVAVNTRYDLIVCNSVLEHVPFPAEVVLDITKSMRKETILYIGVPCEDIIRNAPKNINLHKKKKYWHEHINFFTKKSLKKLLTGCDLMLIGLKRIDTIANGRPTYLYMIACRLSR